MVKAVGIPFRPDWSASAPGRCFASLGDVLAVARPHVPETAIGETAWARLTEAARGWPAGAASHEIGLELRSRDPDRADLIFAVMPGYMSARGVIPVCRNSASQAMQAFGRFLESVDGDRAADLPDRTYVEIDVLEEGRRFGLFAKAPAAPGFPDGAAAARALAQVTATGDRDAMQDWQWAAATVTGLVGPVRNIGGFLEREGAPLRLHARVNDAEGAHDALERLGWDGDLGAVRAFGNGYPFVTDHLTLDTDFRARRLGRKAGVERRRPGGWPEMNPGLWAERLRWAASEGWCDRDQADAWTALIGSHVVETGAGPTTLNLGINHVKFVFGDGDGDGEPFMKLYVGGNMGHLRSAA